MNFPRRGILICFTGVDGSGKTTHAKSLIDYLRTRGYPCEYKWGASRPIFSYILYGITRVLGYWKETKKDESTDPLEYAPKRVHDKNGWICRLIFFLDFQMKTLVTIRLPLFLGRIIVCDRYVYDLLMESIRLNLYSSTFGKILLWSSPNPHVIFLMDAPWSITQARRNGMSKSLILDKKRIYQKLSRNLGFILINTENDFESNRQRIIKETSIVLNS